MMHATDWGQARGTKPGWRTDKGGYFTCARCGFEAGWVFDMTYTEILRGLPCPVCNGSEVASADHGPLTGAAQRG